MFFFSKELLETHENGEAFVAINDTNEEDNHHDDEIVKSINLIEESKEIISRENLLEFDENGEAINAKREEARRKIVNCTNLFEESKDDEEEEEEELNQSNNKNLLEASKNDDDLLSNQVSANCSDKIYPSNLQKQNREEEEETKEVSNSGVSSYISYPQNHRYYGFQDIDLEDEPNNNGDGNEMTREESSYESLFSLSIDNSTRRGNNPLPEIMCDKEEVNSPLKPTLLGRFQNADGLVLDRLEVVHLSSSFEESEQHRLKRSIKFSANDRLSQLSILNPIPNPRPLKDTGIATPTSLLKQQEEKENVDKNLLDFTTTYNCAKKEPSLKREENEIGVDTSLSSWLVEFSPGNSVGSVGNSPSERRVGLVDRPILGSLTVEEITDEKAIVIGTVGSYLRHTGQATGISSY